VYGFLFLKRGFMENYPSNSNKAKRVPQQRPTADKKIEKVTQGSVSRRKTPLGKRFANVFLGGDSKNVWQYIAYDILVPAAKDMLSDAVSSGVDQMLFGGEQRWGRPGRRRGGPSGPLGTMSYGNQGPVNYGNPQRAQQQQGRQMSSRARGMHNFDEIVLESRADADFVLENMYNLLSQYEQVTVSEFYELVGVTDEFTDRGWGWTSLQGSSVVRVRGGYLLDLPRPIVLD
jgi:hypothetical protein